MLCCQASLSSVFGGGPFHFDTHDAWETPYTALNEGLVEAAARNLMQQVFGLPQESCDEPTCSDLADPSDANHIAPYTRPALADLSPAVMEIDDGAGGLDIVHTDNGVRNLLHLLQTDVLHHMSFGTLADGVSNEDANGHPRPQPVMFLANPCSEPDAFDFVELLEAFDGGWLTVDDGIDELVELLSSEYPDRLDAARADVLRELGHANGTGEALDLICDEATPVPTDYGRFIGKRSKGDERRPRARAARGR